MQQQTGLLVTVSQTDKRTLHAFSDQGVLGECLKDKKALKNHYQAKKTFYRTVHGQVINVDNFLVIPIFNAKGQVVALLELSNECKKKEQE